MSVCTSAATWLSSALIPFEERALTADLAAIERARARSAAEALVSWLSRWKNVMPAKLTISFTIAVTTISRRSGCCAMSARYSWRSALGK